MRFLGSVILAGSLVAGCASESPTISSALVDQPDLTNCVKIEGSDIGRLITLEVPDADGEGTVLVTFTGWIAKDGENDEFVGFSLDASATFYVKSGNDIELASGDSYLNPNGTSGPDAKAISYVAICGADGEEEPPPPPPVDECDLNDDGDHVDEGECDYVPPPPPPDDECDHNDDGDHVDEGECDYVPPSTCDANHDGDTTDPGECNHHEEEVGCGA